MGLGRTLPWRPASEALGEAQAASRSSPGQRRRACHGKGELRWNLTLLAGRTDDVHARRPWNIVSAPGASESQARWASGGRMVCRVNDSLDDLAAFLMHRTADEGLTEE